MAAGRPKKYTGKTLREAVDEYFRSISIEEVVKDELGRLLIDPEGNAYVRTKYLTPPTVSGLCLFLGIDRRTWENYCDHEKHPEMEKTTEYVKLRLEAWLEEELLSRQKGVQGIIFNLQNNYGWKAKVETELGKETRTSIEKANSLSMSEKLKIINAAQDTISQAEKDVIQLEESEEQ